MDEFKGTQSITAPSGRFYAVVPHDTNELAYRPRALYVGSDGTLVGVDDEGNEVTFVSLAIGVPHPIRPVRVKATGTTVTGIVALR